MTALLLSAECLCGSVATAPPPATLERAGIYGSSDQVMNGKGSAQGAVARATMQSVRVPAFRYRVALYLLVAFIVYGIAYFFGPYGICPATSNYATRGCPSSDLESHVWDYGPFALTALAVVVGEVLARRSRR